VPRKYLMKLNLFKDLKKESSAKLSTETQGNKSEHELRRGYRAKSKKGMFSFFKRAKTTSFSKAGLELPGTQGEHDLQKSFGTQSQALAFYNKQVVDHITPLMADYISHQEIMHLSTANKRGECDTSFRIGHPGFVTVLSKKYVIYPEFKGNGVMASMGNITENGHASILFIDFFRTTIGLHINGKAKIVETKDIGKWDKHGKIDIESINISKIAAWLLIEVDEAYIHCSKLIPLLGKLDKTQGEHVEKNGNAFGTKSIQMAWETEPA
jgi:predicted pyridoxine 5'-phosphate oxidase superfamily flavin-nucleotide-binding protein